VHDEIVVECREEDAQSVQQTMTDIMCTAPDWASNLPLNIEINVMHRYGKG
jgi:DNA polymerase I-like protein with 3'-5' exonuclease and polymerase domains